MVVLAASAEISVAEREAKMIHWEVALRLHTHGGNWHSLLTVSGAEMTFSTFIH